MKRVCALMLCALLWATADARNPRGLAVAVSTGSSVISFAFVPPTQNTDNSALSVGEVIGYELGLRTGGSAGSYPIVVELVQSTTSTMLSTAIIPALAAGTYFAAVRTTGTTQSAWSTESSFTVN